MNGQNSSPTFYILLWPSRDPNRRVWYIGLRVTVWKTFDKHFVHGTAAYQKRPQGLQCFLNIVTHHDCHGRRHWLILIIEYSTLRVRLRKGARWDTEKKRLKEMDDGRRLLSVSFYSVLITSNYKDVARGRTTAIQAKSGRLFLLFFLNTFFSNNIFSTFLTTTTLRAPNNVWPPRYFIYN